MIVYVDLIFFMNFIYDFFISLTVSITLKRYSKINRLLLSSFIGALSVFLLFLKIPSILFFFIKIIISIIMVIISYSYKNYKYFITNMIYFYMTSSVLAGILNLLNNTFIHADRVLLIILAPFLLLFIIYYSKKRKVTYNYYYNIKIVFDSIIINALAFLDSGNNLVDPVTGKRIIILNKHLLKGVYNIRSPMYVPYKTINGTDLMNVYKPSYIIINNKRLYNYLVGEAKEKLTSGIDCLLNFKMMEDINV